jgi:hypothetical protein
VERGHGRRGQRFAGGFAGIAAVVAGVGGMGLVREQAAGLDGPPRLSSQPCQGLCMQTFTFDHVDWTVTCTDVPGDARLGPTLARAPGVVTEVRAIDGVDADRSLAIETDTCPDAWSLAVPTDE